jgi:hemerythrin-like metal-binding protein
LRLLVEIDEAVSRRASAGEMGGLLDLFVEHANAHFLSEQLLMRNHAYQAYEAHVFEHDMLLSQARTFLKRVSEGEFEDARLFVGSLRDWLLVHMKTTDAAFEEYLSLPAREGGAEVKA